MSGRATLRVVALTVVLLVSGLAGPTVAAAADPVPPVTSTPAAAVLAVAEQGVANAAAQQVEQSVAVIDRSTGRLIADVGGRQAYNTESITKLFTAA
jgi:D-alanyl-D-alanine carboxypeptidase